MSCTICSRCNAVFVWTYNLFCMYNILKGDGTMTGNFCRLNFHTPTACIEGVVLYLSAAPFHTIILRHHIPGMPSLLSMPCSTRGFSPQAWWNEMANQTTLTMAMQLNINQPGASSHNIFSSFLRVTSGSKTASPVMHSDQFGMASSVHIEEIFDPQEAAVGNTVTTEEHLDSLTLGIPLRAGPVTHCMPWEGYARIKEKQHISRTYSKKKKKLMSRNKLKCKEKSMKQKQKKVRFREATTMISEAFMNETDYQNQQAISSPKKARVETPSSAKDLRRSGRIDKINRGHTATGLSHPSSKCQLQQQRPTEPKNIYKA